MLFGHLISFITTTLQCLVAFSLSLDSLFSIQIITVGTLKADFLFFSFLLTRSPHFRMNYEYILYLFLNASFHSFYLNNLFYRVIKFSFTKLIPFNSDVIYIVEFVLDLVDEESQVFLAM